MPWIYLDNNATTQPAPEVVAAVPQMEETLWANPSSVHRFGMAVRQRVELARASVAALIGCRDRELVFTSGGTESNNLALRGVLGSVTAATPTGSPGKRVLITTRIEHSAIREPAEFLDRAGVTRVFLPVDRDGVVNPADLAAALHEYAVTDALVLVSVQWANNETGVIQPIAALAGIVQAQRKAAPAARTLIHVDATQAVGKVPVDARAASVDLLTLSGHKFHAPKGSGALFIRTGVRFQPQNLGGPQERDRRGGTENTPGIVGMGVAADLARAFLEDTAELDRLRALRDRFERGVLTALPGAVAHATGATGAPGAPDRLSSTSAIRSRRAGTQSHIPPSRLWNTTNIAFPRLEAEAILLGLSERGLCASAGAACSSGSLEPSPVLLAMGIPPELAHGSVRFSLSRFTTDHEIDQALAIVPAVVERLAKTMEMGTRR